MNNVLVKNKQLNYSLLTNIANAAFPLLTLPFVLRAFSAEIYGNFVLVNVIYQAITAVFVYSLISYGIREYSQAAGENETSDVVNTMFNLQFFFSFISILFYLCIAYIYSMFDEIKINLVIVFLGTTLFSSINFDWFFYATKDYSVLFKRTVLIKIILFIFVVLFVNNNDDLIIYAIFVSSSYILSNCIGFFIVKRQYTLQFNFNKRYIYNRIKRVKYFLSSASIGIGYQYIDQILVGLLLNKSSLAYLNILKQMIALATMVPSTVCRYKAPDASKRYFSYEKKAYHKQFFPKYMLLIAVILFCILSFGSLFLELFAGDRFDFSYLSIILCSLCVLATSFSAYIDTQHSIPSGLEKVTTFGNIIVLLVNLILLLSLIDKLGYNGAILSLFIAELVGVFTVLFMHKHKYKSFEGKI